jgi:hypothetical protein
MTDTSVLLLCSLIAFITIGVVYVMNKITAARLYRDMVETDLPKSPYGVSREYGGGGWGYCITKNGEVMYSENKSRVFLNFKHAVNEINKLESIEGYQKTKIR